MVLLVVRKIASSELPEYGMEYKFSRAGTK
jgi:hypothetical protein